jgi:hypothetical protein
LTNDFTDTDALVTIQMQWGKIEILAFGDADKQWTVHSMGFPMSNYFATPGLHLRLTEDESVVHILCGVENEFKAWLPVEQEPDIVYSSYGRAVTGVFGFAVYTKKPSKNIGFPSKIFTSILNHFVVGTPRRTNERFHITAEGERLRAPPIYNAMENDVSGSKKKRTKFVNDDYDDNGNDENDHHFDGRDLFPAKELRQRQPDLKIGESRLNRLQGMFL